MALAIRISGQPPPYSTRGSFTRLAQHAQRVMQGPVELSSRHVAAGSPQHDGAGLPRATPGWGNTTSVRGQEAAIPNHHICPLLTPRGVLMRVTTPSE